MTTLYKNSILLVAIICPLLLFSQVENEYSWRFNECGVTNFIDEKSDVNLETVSCDIVEGYNGIGLQFDGLSSYATIQNSLQPVSTTNFSISFWVKGASQENAVIFTKNNGLTTSNSWGISTGEGVNSDKLIARFYGSESGSLVKKVQTSNVIFDNSWHNVTITFALGEVKVFKDGVQESLEVIANDSFSSYNGNTVNVLIGKPYDVEEGLNYFNGIIDEVNIREGALNLDEVVSLSNIDNAPLICEEIKSNLGQSQCGAIKKLNEKITSTKKGKKSLYRYYVLNIESGEEEVIVKSKNNFRLSDLKIILEDNTIYQVRVQNQVNGVWSEYGDICSLTSDLHSFSEVSILEQYCGRQDINLKEKLKTNKELNAVAYEFRITNKLLKQTQYIFSKNNSVKLSKAKEPIFNNAEYEISARPILYTGNKTEFGEKCLIKTDLFDHPITFLASNSMILDAVSLTNKLKAVKVKNATSYTFLVENLELGYSEVIVSKDNSIRLVSLIGEVLDQTEYNIRVKTTVNNEESEFGPIVKIKTFFDATTDTKVLKLYSEVDVTLTMPVKARRVKNAEEYSFLIFNNKLNYSQEIISKDPSFVIKDAAVLPISGQRYFIKVKTKTNGFYNDYGGNVRVLFELENVNPISLKPEFCYLKNVRFDMPIESNKDDNSVQYEFKITNTDLKFEEFYISENNEFSFLNLNKDIEGATKYNVQVRGINVYGNKGVFGEECVLITEKQQLLYTFGNTSLYNPEAGWIELDVRSTYTPFEYKWSVGASTNRIENLITDVYKVSVTNSRGEEFFAEIPIVMDVSVVETTNLQGDNNKIENIGDLDGDVGFGRSENLIGAVDDGYFSVKIGVETLNFAISLSEGFDPENYNKSNFSIFAKDGFLYSNVRNMETAEELALDRFRNKIKVSEGSVIKIEKNIVGKDVVVSFSVDGYVFRKYSSPELIKQQYLASFAIGDIGGKLLDLSGIFSAELFLTVKNCDTWSESQHYIDNKIFDENGVLASHSREFYDKLGRLVQNQQRDFENGNVIANQTVYDQHGRKALNSLAAPIFESSISCYYDKFFTNQQGEEYSYKDFNKALVNDNYFTSGGVNNPKSVGYGLQGSLGWYYSNANSVDEQVASSRFPFLEVEYYDDPFGRVKRVAKAGESLKMGSNHESKYFYLEDGSELRYVTLSYPNFMVSKTVMVDSEGATNINYTDRKGRLIGTAKSGLESNCLPQKIVNTMEYYGTKSSNIHLPESGKNSVYLHLDLLTGASFDDVLLSIIDLESGRELIENQDYIRTTISDSKQHVIFSSGDYATGQNFFKFSYEYTYDFENSFWQTNYYPSSRGDLKIVYELDYSDWAINQYDQQTGNLVATISPKGIDCGQYDPNIGYYWETYNENSGMLDINNNFSIGTDIYTTDEYLDGNSAAYDPADHNHKIQLIISPYGLVIEPGELDPCTIPTSGTTQFITPGVNQTQQIYAANLNGWEDVDEYTNYSATSSHSINATKYVTSNLNQELLQIKSQGTGGSGDPDPDPDPDPCEDIDDQRVATYKYSIAIFAGNQQIDRNGTPMQMVYHFYPRLMKTCECMYYWDMSSFESLHIFIENSLLNQSSDVHIELVDMQVAVGISVIYEPVDPSLFEHSMGQFMSFVTRYTHTITPKVPSPPPPTFDTQLTSNGLDQLVSKESADDGTTKYVYNNIGSLRFQQNELQANNNKFSYFNYDRAGRLVETGEYNTAIGGIQFQVPENSFNVQQTLNALPVLVGANTSAISIVDQMDGLDDASCTEQKSMLYDVVDWPLSAIGTVPSDILAYEQTFTLGKLSKSWNDKSTTWYSYDDYGRANWTIQYIAELAEYKTIKYEYDLLGNVQEVIYQGETTDETFIHYYNYDKNRRMQEVYTSEDDVVSTLPQAVYDYNLNGSLKRSEIAGDLQGIDYTYTINGWLKSINNANTDYDPGMDGFDGVNVGFEKDVFSLTLDYFNNDYSRRGTFMGTYSDLQSDGSRFKGLYNGLITTERWRTRTDSKPWSATVKYDDKDLMYTYKYDKKYQLIEAKFGEVINQGGQNTNQISYASSVEFDKYGNVIPGSGYKGPMADLGEDYQVSNLSYDKNGNILFLKRNGIQSLAGLAMDDFTYDYKYGTNQLERVIDAVQAVAPQISYPDIKPQGTNNYQYNEIGQCVADVLQGNYYVYNTIGLTDKVYADPAHTILKASYDYDEKGSRLKEATYNVSGTLVKDIYYVRDASGALMSFYEIDYAQQNPVLVQTQMPIYGTSRLGFFDKVDGTSKYELHDQKGSVRAAITYNSSLGALELVSMADYYPYGMIMPGRSFESGEDPFFKFGGQEFEAELGLSSFPLRMYEGRLGRFITPDPMNQFFSPYMANFNNPINFIDPSGGQSEEVQSAEDEGSGWDSEGLRDLMLTWGLPGDLVGVVMEHVYEFDKMYGKYGVWIIESTRDPESYGLDALTQTTKFYPFNAYGNYGAQNRYYSEIYSAEIKEFGYGLGDDIYNWFSNLGAADFATQDNVAISLRNWFATANTQLFGAYLHSKHGEAKSGELPEGKYVFGNGGLIDEIVEMIKTLKGVPKKNSLPTNLVEQVEYWTSLIKKGVNIRESIIGTVEDKTESIAPVKPDSVMYINWSINHNGVPWPINAYKAKNVWDTTNDSVFHNKEGEPDANYYK